MTVGRHQFNAVQIASTLGLDQPARILLNALPNRDPRGTKIKWKLDWTTAWAMQPLREEYERHRSLRIAEPLRERQASRNHPPTTVDGRVSTSPTSSGTPDRRCEFALANPQCQSLQTTSVSCNITFPRIPPGWNSANSLSLVSQTRAWCFLPRLSVE